MKNNWELRNVGVVVRDLDKALEYYQSLGISTLEPGEEKLRIHNDELVFGTLVPFKTRAKRVRVGNVWIELIQPVEGNGIHMEFLNKYGGGIQHIDFYVDDLEKETAILVKRGIKVMLIRESKSPFTYFDTRGVGNITIELAQRREVAKVAESDWKFRHLGVVVKDMGKTLEYFQSMGIGDFEPGIPETETRTELVYGKPVTFKIKLGKVMRIGNADIELVQPVEGKSLHQEFLDTQGEGMHHISFAVDFEKERAKLVGKGVPIVLSRENDNSFSYFDMRKFGDTLIELNQRR